ncbi:MAG: ABC transporter permease subunit [Armatimonadetes bacterium]|nr:ABC transporter permease subunit [Armatimonadota bacterium]
MTRYVFQTALRDMVRPQRVAAWAAVTGIVFLISRVWAMLAADLGAAESFGRVEQVVVLRVIALAAAVFGTMVVSQEVEQKTIVYLITRPVPRWSLALGRMLAATVVGGVVAIAAEFAASLAVVGPANVVDPRFWQDLLVLFVGVAAYTGFFVFLSLVVARSLVLSLLFAFGWETFVPNMPGDMYYVSILTYLRSATPHAVVAGSPSLGDFLTGASSPKSVAAPAAWIALLVLVIGLWWLCLWWFGRFEYSPREEAA